MRNSKITSTRVKKSNRNSSYPQHPQLVVKHNFPNNCTETTKKFKIRWHRSATFLFVRAQMDSELWHIENNDAWNHCFESNSSRWWEILHVLYRYILRWLWFVFFDLQKLDTLWGSCFPRNIALRKLQTCPNNALPMIGYLTVERFVASSDFRNTGRHFRNEIFSATLSHFTFFLLKSQWTVFEFR